MNQKTRNLLVTAAVLLFPLTGSGGKPRCDSCGCEAKVKKITRLMYVCEEIEIPCYACQPTNAFLPDKGKVCRCEYRCDVNCKLYKTCGCKPKCCCETKCSCQKTVGAKATGCHCQRCVRQPVETKKYRVPVLKWVTISVCKDGCDARGGRH